MRICVFGAGAVGGHFAVRLAQAGHEVSIVARGEHLAAIVANGLTLIAGEEQATVRVRATSSARYLERQDIVLVTLKTTSLSGLPAAIAPLLGANTSVVFAQNGIPWWYNVGLGAAPVATPDLTWMDPAGELTSLAGRAIGAVIYSANEAVAPGVVRNNSAGSNRLVVGELDDRQSTRIAELRGAFSDARIASPETISIRRAMWSKLVLNISSSLLAVAEGVPASELRREPRFEAMFQALHAEAFAIAHAHCPALEPAEPMKPRGGHRSSILQDYERGRPMEIDSLVVAPLAFARAAGIATPALDALAVRIVEKASRAGLYEPTRPLPLPA